MAHFITNPGSAVHSVEPGEFERLTRLPGYRESTVEEIAAWHTAQGLSLPPELRPPPPATDNAPTTDDATQDLSTAQLADPPTRIAPASARKSRR